MLHEEFFGDALCEDFASRIDSSVGCFDEAVAAFEGVVGNEIEFRAGFGLQGRDKFGVGGVEADVDAVCADRAFEGGADQVDHGFGMSGQCATEQSFGDGDAESDGFFLALVEPAVALGVQLLGGGVQRGECGLQLRLGSRFRSRRLDGGE